MHGPVPTLIDIEARVLGVLIEKALTTPDQYPLSLNATTSGCNQKSNRDPVTEYSEAEVLVALHGLTPKGLGGRVLVAGSRVERFRHTANEKLGLNDAHLAVLAELLMRGPQAQGELRARVHRMAPTASLDALRERLEKLIERGLVGRLAPAPGSRAERFVQLLCPGLHGDAAAAAPTRETSAQKDRFEPVKRVAPVGAGAPVAAGPAGTVGAPASARPSNAAESGADAAAVAARVAALERKFEELSRKFDELTEALGG